MIDTDKPEPVYFKKGDIVVSTKTTTELVVYRQSKITLEPGTPLIIDESGSDIPFARLGSLLLVINAKGYKKVGHIDR